MQASVWASSKMLMVVLMGRRVGGGEREIVVLSSSDLQASADDFVRVGDQGCYGFGYSSADEYSVGWKCRFGDRKALR